MKIRSQFRQMRRIQKTLHFNHIIAIIFLPLSLLTGIITSVLGFSFISKCAFSAMFIGFVIIVIVEYLYNRKMFKNY